MKCSHMENCSQKVVKGSLPLCKGARKGFDFDKCFTEHSLDREGMYVRDKSSVGRVRLPSEWDKR